MTVSRRRTKRTERKKRPAPSISAAPGRRQLDHREFNDSFKWIAGRMETDAPRSSTSHVAAELQPQVQRPGSQWSKGLYPPFVEGADETGCNDGAAEFAVLANGRAGRLDGGGGTIGRSVSAMVGGVEESEASTPADDADAGGEGAGGIAAGGLVAVNTSD